MKGYLLIFKEEFLITYLERLEAQKSIQLFNELIGSPLINLNKKNLLGAINVIERIEEEYFKISDAYSQGIIRSELHILITKLYRIKSKSKKIITDKAYLNEFIKFQNLVERQSSTTFKVSDYAFQMAVSTKTLNTISKNIIGRSAKEFIDDIRVMQIKRLLINTTDSVKEVAFQVGFEEIPNFYKYFKRLVGSTPEQFRAEH